MTKEQAIEELMFQSGSHSDIHNSRWKEGFLGMLRPFNGQLFEINFHSIVRAIHTLADSFSNEKIDKEIMSSIWGICHLGREWAVKPDGMLRSNDLIIEHQVKEVENWIDHISWITCCLLDGLGKEEAFANYESEFNKRLD